MVWTKISAPSLVTGSLGTSITVRCHYSPLYKNHTKYWCEGVIYELCKIVVKTTKPRRWGRASIRDDTQNGFFTVTTSALRWSDKGKYWCVIARPGRNVFTGVFLEIVKAENSTTSKPEEDSKTFDGWAVLRWILFAALLASFLTVNVCKSFPECSVFAEGSRRCLRVDT
ncbi:CMRF35-like molecule 5 [Scleropages formosus]|uniref:CMRF35-like molecule 5 n=1 Tax=Scleropages formosus TaxID=113540 RepID=UPI00087815CE|nr:CMRF35-like molecule 5 [Scleropages formosus]